MGAKVILTTLFPLGRVPLEQRLFWSDDVALAVDEVNAFIRSQSGGDVLVLDAYSVLAGEDGSIRPEYSHDLLHLSAAGYERLNDELVAVLKMLDQRAK